MKKLKTILKESYNYLRSRFGDSVYNIGIIPFPDNLLKTSTLPPIKWLQHNYKDRWFADPFIVEEDEYTYTIFVETYMYKKRKGEIGRIKATKDSFLLLEYSTILELSTHLSFPAYFKKGNNIYVYPENSRSGKLNLYRYDKQLDQLIFEKEIAPLPLTDAVLLNNENGCYLFSTLSEKCNGNECNIFKYDESKESFVFDSAYRCIDNTARGAGLPFMLNDMMIRPAQICNDNYGTGVVLQNIHALNGKLSLSELCRFPVYDLHYNVGFHTFNKFDNVAIVDGYHYPSKCGLFLFNWLNKIIFK